MVTSIFTRRILPVATLAADTTAGMMLAATVAIAAAATSLAPRLTAWIG